MARQQLFDEVDVARCGLAVVARTSWSGVSVRSVAEELRVTPMALYRVVADAAALRRLIADSAASALQPKPAPLRRMMRDWAIRTYDALDRYPGLAGYVIGEWTELPAWLDIVERCLERAATDGLKGPESVAHVNAVFAFVLVRGQLRDSAATRPRRSLAPVAASPDRYRRIAENRAEFAVAQSDKHFAFGLDSILSAIPASRNR